MIPATHTAQAPRPGVSVVLWRFSLPFFLFSVILTSLLAASYAFLLPRYMRIEVGGAPRSAEQIRALRAELTSQIVAKEEERRRLVLAVHDPQFEALQERRRERIPLDELRERLATQAATITGKEDVVQWHSFTYDPDGKTLRIRGEIRNVGTRSMTVLAEFAQSLTSLQFVASATTPAFTREEDAKIGFRSPFDITLTLQ